MRSTGEMTDIQAAREYQTLAEAARVLKQPIPLSNILNAILEKVFPVIGQADFGVVMIWDQSSGLFRPWASYGCDPVGVKRIGLRAGESITGRVFEEGVAMLLNSRQDVEREMENMRPGNYSILSRAVGHDFKTTCTIAVPISVVAQKFGVLVLESLSEGHQFHPEEIPFLQSMADLMAIAIDYSRQVAKADLIRQTREAEQLRSELIATLSHELRMPLTTIKGYATMLLMDEVKWENNQINEYLHLIDEECDSMQSMIKSILESSLIDVNQLSIEAQPLRLETIARQVADEIQRQTSGHRLILDLSSGLPLVNADSRWIKQVFRNILDNAVKYSPNGGLIVIHAEVRKEDVVVSIADQGIGISPEDLIPIFEKYYRVRNNHTRCIPGTGLGLPIARAIVEVHGGRIWADSKLGQGTTVFFSLPILKINTGPLAPLAAQNTDDFDPCEPE
ncbi:histidine kinase [Longilinea arvoryzae]|uniref:histidine kinase n=1 Tax=Longilinea arvoryzae TaxID=360412 RepID=A0A0S7BGM7_9CHLR|nr:ATP-binding protein [Longilinea arvoryzae]GAP13699.1 histidine kinase [Longilinea arvoryzae]